MATIKEEAMTSLTQLSGELTHAKLVKCGRDWLTTKGCNPVFTEKGYGGGEIPDVIGWDNNECYVLECKISLADYRADQHKEHRHSNGLGSRRYYVVPEELKDKIPNDTGWGLIVVRWYEYGACWSARQANGRGSKQYERTPYKEVSFLRLRIMDIQDYGLSRDIR